jgi:hypothetical protein
VTTLLCSDGSLVLAFSDVQIRSKVGFAPKASFADVNQGSGPYEEVRTHEPLGFFAAAAGRQMSPLELRPGAGEACEPLPGPHGYRADRRCIQILREMPMKCECTAPTRASARFTTIVSFSTRLRLATHRPAPDAKALVSACSHWSSLDFL